MTSLHVNPGPKRVHGKGGSVIFVLISRTNFSRNFVRVSLGGFGSLLFALLAKSKLDVDFALNVALFPGNVHAPKIARSHFAWLVFVARGGRIAAGRRGQNLIRIASQASHFRSNPIQPADED
jgi:hypothetical protein